MKLESNHYCVCKTLIILNDILVFISKTVLETKRYSNSGFRKKTTQHYTTYLALS